MKKPKYYKIHLTKSERKGKTQEEIKELRVKKFKEKTKRISNEQ